MRYIAINTAAPIIELLVVYDDKQQFISLEKVMAAEQLLPAIDRILEEMRLEVKNFDDYVCVVGPGSFTGIRIGVNTVRAFAYSLKKNAYGVTYNRLMAYNTIGGVTTFVDGGNGVCYAAAYNGDETVAEPICIYKKDAEAFKFKYNFSVIADYDMGVSLYTPNGEALKKAAEYAIKNKLGTEPLYIRKPQPERKDSDI